MICPICESLGFSRKFSSTDYITGDSFDIRQCRYCKVAVTYPPLSVDELRKYYKNKYYGQRKSFIESYINFIRGKLVNKYGPADRERSILDIGCGNGTLLLVLKKIGWKISGTELAPNSYINKEISPYVCRKPIKECRYQDGTFDVVTMWHFLEHINDPLDYLKEAHRVLKKDGKILIEVPNIESWQAIITKKDWFHLDVPRHIFHFSPQSLEILFKKAGFTDIRTKHTNLTYCVFGYTQSILNFMTKKRNFLFDILNGEMTGSELAKNMGTALITAAAILPLSAVSFVLYLGEKYFKRGGIIQFSAKKV